MNEKIVSLLRVGREILQTVAEPLDWTTRMLNNKHGYPPLRIRQKVGGLNDFEGSGAEYMAYLKLLCGLKPGMDVLDIGCGCGLMCLPVNENQTLPDYIKPGTYWGFDIDERLLEWCWKHVTDNNTRFHSVSSIPLKNVLDTDYFDVALCKSLFTHLYAHETEDYLREIHRLLKPNGSCLSTWFLLDDRELRGHYTFENDEGIFSLQRYSKPRLAVAYELGWVLETLDRTGFVYDFHWGSWRGTGGGLSFQDIIVMRKA